MRLRSARRERIVIKKDTDLPLLNTRKVDWKMRKKDSRTTSRRHLRVSARSQLKDGGKFGWEFIPCSTAQQDYLPTVMNPYQASEADNALAHEHITPISSSFPVARKDSEASSAWTVHLTNILPKVLESIYPESSFHA